MLDGAHLWVVPHVLQDVARVGGHNADHLGHVQRRAATKTDHAVSAMRLVGRGAVHHLAAGRVTEHAGKHRHVEPAQVSLEFGQHRQGTQRPVGHDQRALATHFQQMGGHQLARTGAETDGGRKGKVGNAHGVR